MGPRIRFHLAYNQSDGVLATTSPFSNLGPKWTHSYLSFVEDEVATRRTVGHTVTIYLRGGGVESHEGYFEPGTTPPGRFATNERTRAILLYDWVNDLYERHLPDGSKEEYRWADAGTGARRVHLSRIVDARDQGLTLWYQSQPGGVALTGITDAIGETTLFGYQDPAWPLAISWVLEPGPEGRSATFTYHPVGHPSAGRLATVTDMIGMTASFAYGSEDRVEAMTTEYGTTTFGYHEESIGPPPHLDVGPWSWITATDPEGGTERLEYRHRAPGVPSSTATETPDPALMVVENGHLEYRNSFYWNKKAYAETWGLPSPPPEDEIFPMAHIYHWLHTASSIDYTLPVLESERPPLENRIYYRYAGQPDSAPYRAVPGMDTRPTRVARKLGDGTTQMWQFQYNDRGRLTQRVDPKNRITSFEFHDDPLLGPLDLHRVWQFTGGGQDLLLRIPTYDRHQPTEVIDGAGQHHLFDYDDTTGQLLWARNPRNETTSFIYTNGYLTDVVRPLGWHLGIEYDLNQRPYRFTNQDNDVFELEYDELDRPRKLTFPDLTTRTWTWDRLDLQSFKDREDRVTEMTYDDLGRLLTVKDPLDRVTTLEWCNCGGLEKLIDPLNHSTTWERDLQGRVTRKVREDGSFTTFEYEPQTSRLWKLHDLHPLPHGPQVIEFKYGLDNALEEKLYTNAINPTANIHFNWEPFYPRLLSMEDGTGTTFYEYHLPGALGAGQLKAEHGPDGFGAAFGYDELGRRNTEAVEASAELFGYVREFDALGRLVLAGIGEFPWEIEYQYTDPSPRPAALAYDNGLATSLTWWGASKSRRLRYIDHSLGAPPPWHWGYDWSDEGDLTSQAIQTTAYTVVPDAAGQLLSYGASSQPAGNWLYSYDDAGNRVTEQQSEQLGIEIEYDDLNQIEWADLGGATQRLFEHDANGNCTSDTPLTGAPTVYLWDAEDRLVEVNRGTLRSVFTYDGLDRRVRIREYDGLTPLSDTRYVWCGARICAEVPSFTAPWPRRILFPEGEHDLFSGQTNYYLRDHLGSVYGLVDPSLSVIASYEYDPWGRQRYHNGAADAVFGYAGYFHHDNSGLNLTYYRAYDPTLGRWLSRDPIGEFANGFGGATDASLYAYVSNRSLTHLDPMGLGYNPSGIINLDPVAYPAFGDPSPFNWDQPMVIPPGIPAGGQMPGLGVVPPWWDVDFICTPDGWRMVKGVAIVFGGQVVPSTAPPANWPPPFACPPTREASSSSCAK